MNDSHPAAPLIDQISTTFDSITVDSSYFQVNQEYKLTCKARNADSSVYGFVSKQYNTVEFSDKIGIGMSPARGASYLTNFSIYTMKPTSEALHCVIGYKNSLGEVIIEDLTGAGKRFSSQNQALQTKLPSPDDGSGLLHVFARCYDVYGRHKTAEVKIMMESSDALELDSNTSDQYVQTIKRNLENG